MSAARNPFNYPLNPNYGHGVYHRRVRLSPEQDSNGQYILAELEDCNHGFVIKVYFDQNQVTAIEPEAKRIPLTTCAGAAKVLEELIGFGIHSASRELYAKLDLSAHCTHWLDLSIWAIAHAGRCIRTEEFSVRDYHITVPDELEEGTNTQLLLNNQPILQWHIKDWVLTHPEKYQGKPFYKGFAAWANGIDDDLEREAAFVLQKAYFVSRARLYDINSLAGEAASKHSMMLGACYSYSEPRVKIAERTAGTVRDFSDCPEQLLTFS